MARTVRNRGVSRKAFEHLQQRQGKIVSMEQVGKAIGTTPEVARGALDYIASKPVGNPAYRDVRRVSAGWYVYDPPQEQTTIGDDDGYLLLKVIGTATDGGYLVLDEENSRVYTLLEAGDL